jgi:hypothetical protein
MYVTVTDHHASITLMSVYYGSVSGYYGCVSDPAPLGDDAVPPAR